MDLAFSVSHLARPAALAIEPYVWEAANQEIADRYGLDPAQIVRFDTNTPPLPPPCLDAVLDQARAERQVNEYFDGSYAALAAALEAYLGFSPEHLVIGAGADEILDVLVKTFLDPGDVVVLPTPTYALYRICASTMAAQVRTLPTRPDLTFDPDAIITAARGAKMLFLCNPNNPTAGVLPLAEVERIIRGVDCLVVVDEAYAEFWGQSIAPLVREEPRLVVVRTLSKAFALAGARVGYAICNPEVAGLANRMRPPNSISYISALLGEAALWDLPAMQASVQALRAERAWMAEELQTLAVEVLPSETNFLLTRWPSPDHARQAAAAALRSGLVLRTYSDHPILGSYLRIATRTRAHNNALLDVLRTVIGAA